MGVSRHTFAPIGEAEHLRQSITDILTTPLGSRVMRRDYGSRLFELVDRPLQPSTLLAIIQATAEALIRWEPRLLLERVRVTGEPGRVRIGIEGRTTRGEILRTEAVL